MSEFLTPVDLRIAEKGWVVLNDIKYQSDFLNTIVTVPEGFFTDLASVPKPLQAIVPVANARNRPAAVVHDFLCYPENQYHYGINQMNADAIFREAMLVCGTPWYRRWYMWFFVRIYQWWKND